MNTFSKLALLLCAGVLTLTACSDDNEGPCPCNQGGGGTHGFYVLNQGNISSAIYGSLDWNGQDGKQISDIFTRNNQIALGENPQDVVVSGSKMYIAEYTSNRIWVVTADSAKLIRQIPLTQPNKLYAEGAYVYATSNTGTVARIDTASFYMREQNVGPNPVGLTAANGYLYVANSDGYNYPSYANGKSVTKLRLSDFSVEKTIAVGLNPQTLVADSRGNVFVYCGGNYADIAPVVQRISPTDVVTDFTSASMMATDGGLLYLIKQTYDAQYRSTYEYFTMNTETGDTLSSASQPMLQADQLPFNPTGIFVNPKTHQLFITSDAPDPSDPTANRYSLKGYVFRYDSEGKFLQRYNAGVHPVAVAFN